MTCVKQQNNLQEAIGNYRMQGEKERKGTKIVKTHKTLYFTPTHICEDHIIRDVAIATSRMI